MSVSSDGSHLRADPGKQYCHGRSPPDPVIQIRAKGPSKVSGGCLDCNGPATGVSWCVPNFLSRVTPWPESRMACEVVQRQGRRSVYLASHRSRPSEKSHPFPSVTKRSQLAGPHPTKPRQYGRLGRKMIANQDPHAYQSHTGKPWKSAWDPMLRLFVHPIGGGLECRRKWGRPGDICVTTEIA